MTPRPLIVFDLDGTLIDSRRDLADSTNDMLASYEAAPLSVEAVTAMVGDGVRALVERALHAAGRNPTEPEALQRFLTIYDRRLLIHTRPYEGIPAVVRDASTRAAVGLLTNKAEAPARRLLEAFGFDTAFAAIVGGDSGYARKPDTAGLLHLIATVESTVAQTLLIGDSTVDAETARRGRVTFCLARYGFGRAADCALAVTTPADLHAVISSFVAGVQSAHTSGGLS